MEISVNCKPKMLIRKQNSILLSWESVFTPDNNLIYILEMFDSIDSWIRCYWGRKTQTWVQSLAPNSIYKYRLMAKIPGTSSSNWIEFKSATNIEHYFTKHLTRAITFSKIHSLRKIIASRPHLLYLENDEMKFPLLQATENNDFSIVNVLINLGANINQQCSNGKTALMMALFYGYLNIANHLLSKGGSLELVDINGKNGLHYAIDSNNYEAVQLALEHKCPINVKDSKGWSPIIRAVIMEASDEIIKFLLESGAEQSFTDNNSLDFKKHTALSNRVYLSEF